MAQAKTLSDAELKIALAVIAQGRNAARNRLMVLLSHYGGMRVGEIAALQIPDVINQTGVVNDEIRLTPDQTKGHRARVIMVSDKLRKEIGVYVNAIGIKHQPGPLIYSQKTRTGFSANSLGQEFKTIYQRAGITGASSHSGRRTFITQLAAKGVGVRVLMSLAGHRSISTTQVYIDVNDQMKRRAVNLL
jgi:integrase/recombinase XerD